MLKKIFIILFFFLGFSNLIWAQTSLDYRLDQFGLSLQYPEAWTLEENETAENFAFVISSTADFFSSGQGRMLMGGIWTQAQAETMGATSIEDLWSMMGATIDEDEITKSEYIKLGGQHCLYVEIIDQDEQARAEMFFIKANTYYYIIVTGIQGEDLEKDNRDLKNIITSIQFYKPTHSGK